MKHSLIPKLDVLLFLLFTLTCLNANAQNNSRISLISDFVQISMVEITNEDAIQFLIDQLSLPEEAVFKIIIFDIDKNGCGEMDVLRVISSYSDSILFSESCFLHPPISENLQLFLDSIRPKIYSKIATPSKSPETFENVDKAEYRILADILRSLEENYGKLPINLLFNRNESGMRFQLWDYDPTVMQNSLILQIMFLFQLLIL